MKITKWLIVNHDISFTGKNAKFKAIKEAERISKQTKTSVAIAKIIRHVNAYGEIRNSKQPLQESIVITC